MRTLFFCAILLGGLLVTGCNEDAIGTLNTDNTLGVRTPATHCEADLLTGIPDNPVVTGTTKITRNENAVSMTLKAEGLVPGHAYTAWWVVWNYPEYCDGPCDDPDIVNPDVQAEVIYATGHVAGSSGKGNFGASLDENDATGSINEEFFGLPSYGGLHDAMHADIFVVLRSHGPAIPGQVNEQISTYAGGCNPDDPNYNGGHGFIPFFNTVPEQEGECSSLFVSIFRADCE